MSAQKAGRGRASRCRAREPDSGLHPDNPGPRIGFLGIPAGRMFPLGGPGVTGARAAHVDAAVHGRRGAGNRARAARGLQCPPPAGRVQDHSWPQVPVPHLCVRDAPLPAEAVPVLRNLKSRPYQTQLRIDLQRDPAE